MAQQGGRVPDPHCQTCPIAHAADCFVLVQGFQHCLCRSTVTPRARLVAKSTICINCKVSNSYGNKPMTLYFCTLVCTKDKRMFRHDMTSILCFVAIKVQCSLQPGTHAVKVLGKDAFGHIFDDSQDRALELLKRCEPKSSILAFAQVQKFSMALRSGEFGGQLGRNSTLEPCSMFHS